MYSFAQRTILGWWLELEGFKLDDMFNVAQALGVAHMRFNTFLYAICLVFVCTILSFPSVGAAQTRTVSRLGLIF